MKWDIFEERCARIFIYISVTIVMFSLVWICAVIVSKGISSLSFEMVSQTPSGGYYLGKGGGVLNAIIGSLYIAFSATIISFILGLPVAIYLQKEYSTQERNNELLRLMFDTLFGIPSIVYGACGFTLMVFLGLRASLLMGIITVTLLELPIMIRGLDETLKLIPAAIKEASYSLGATRLETYLKTGLRQAFPGIITAVIVAFGRGIGDAASVLFTAGFSDNIPTSLLQPVATLPLAIFFQLGTPFPEVQNRAYASAIILLIIIIIINCAIIPLNRRISRNIIK